MKVNATVEQDIDRCYHSCHYFSLEGGPSPIMVCTHPECDTGFPKQCPLRDEQ